MIFFRNKLKHSKYINRINNRANLINFLFPKWENTLKKKNQNKLLFPVHFFPAIHSIHNQSVNTIVIKSINSWNKSCSNISNKD